MMISNILCLLLSKLSIMINKKKNLSKLNQIRNLNSVDNKLTLKIKV